MAPGLYITETRGGFKPQNSLLDAPFVFETSLVRGSVFYLPFQSNLGADTFVIKAEETIMVSLVGDMQGHGAEDRQKVVPFLEKLNYMADLAVSEEYSVENLTKIVAELDRRADCGFRNMFALSFVRILRDGAICYLNEGENRVLVYSEGAVSDHSVEMSHGKIGLLKLIVGDEAEIIANVKPYKQQLYRGDRILICSDGVIDYAAGVDDDQRLLQVRQILASGGSLEGIVSEINCQAQQVLNRDASHLSDDYTLIALELK